MDEQSAWFDGVVIANSVDSDADRRHQASRLTTDPTRKRAGMSRRVRVGQRNPNKPNPVKHNKLIGARAIATKGIALVACSGRELRWSRARLGKRQSRERAPRKRS
jgi:hypothetical protein